MGLVDELRLFGIALSLTQAGYPDTALEFFNLISNPQQKKIHLAEFAHSQVMTGDFTTARAVIDTIPDPEK
jgi:hypothetical protein